MWLFHRYCSAPRANDDGRRGRSRSVRNDCRVARRAAAPSARRLRGSGDVRFPAAIGTDAGTAHCPIDPASPPPKAPRACGIKGVVVVVRLRLRPFTFRQWTAAARAPCWPNRHRAAVRGHHRSAALRTPLTLGYSESTASQYEGHRCVPAAGRPPPIGLGGGSAMAARQPMARARPPARDCKEPRRA
jgi:hypothetical protein